MTTTHKLEKNGVIFSGTSPDVLSLDTAGNAWFSGTEEEVCRPAGAWLNLHQGRGWLVVSETAARLENVVLEAARPLVIQMDHHPLYLRVNHPVEPSLLQCFEVFACATSPVLSPHLCVIKPYGQYLH